MRYGRGRSRSSSAKIAMSYRRRPLGQRMALARSLTIASKPAPSTAANQRWYPSGPDIRARSTGRDVPAARAPTSSRAAATWSAGRPTAVAKSLPVPAGITPNGTPVPATAWTARWTVPSPPTATSAAAPSATARAHAASASAAVWASSTTTSRPPVRSADRAAVTDDSCRPRPAVGPRSTATRPDMVGDPTCCRRRSGTANPTWTSRPARPARSATPRRRSGWRTAAAGPGDGR